MLLRRVFRTALKYIFILLVIGILICEANKAYWDHKVDQLCRKNAGVTIYEKVVISKSDYPNMRFAFNGDPIIPFEKNAKPEDPFFYTANTKYLYVKFPDINIVEYERLIIRSLDKKVMAKILSYGRGGGDFPTGLMFPSSFSCEDMTDLHSFDTTIFLMKGE